MKKSNNIARLTFTKTSLNSALRFKGLFRLTGVLTKSDSNNTPFWLLKLCNFQEKRTVLLFPEIKSDVEFVPFMIYHIEAKLTDIKGNQFYKCVHITAVCSWRAKLESHLDCLPLLNSLIRPQLMEFRQLLENIDTDALKSFCVNVLRDDITLIKFLTVPASIRHHHAYRHGLFIHSVEVASSLSKRSGLKHIDKDIAVVAALFHDIGKILTLTVDKSYTGLGSLVNHDSLTLEVCSSALKLLDSSAPSLSAVLRQIWCQSHQHTYTKLHINKLLSEADRSSAIGVQH